MWAATIGGVISTGRTAAGRPSQEAGSGAKRTRAGWLGLLLAVVVMAAGGVSPVRAGVTVAVLAAVGAWFVRSRPRPAGRGVLVAAAVAVAVGQVAQARFGGAALAGMGKASVVMVVAGAAFVGGALIAEWVQDGWRVWLPAALAAVVAVLLPLVPGIGVRSRDGASVSVTIAGQSLVSAEFARVLFIVAAAGLLSETGRLLSLPPARFRGIAVPDPRAVGPLFARVRSDRAAPAGQQ